MLCDFTNIQRGRLTPSVHSWKPSCCLQFNTY